ncbi:MAG: GNAT family N-acetyltransferase [Candidatus Omnitrophica bacterium]|nr:GNAT family N-acetyltransferase [Candidatus Omnitrophota bacterium]MBU1995857.1 GNAT family N-acetyltransferase [Candidatus Omnitrophota bacterium]
MIKFLDGKKVYLRSVTEEDLQGEYLRWINDVKNDFYTEHAQFPNSQKDLVAFAEDKWNCSSSIWLAIIEKKTNKHIGNIELRDINLVHGRGEFLILLDHLAQSKGYGEEASRLMLCHAFEVLNLRRIYLGVRQDNKGAIKLYKKLGFVEEGVLRENVMRDFQTKNIIVMGILDREYRKLKLKEK